jgi:hypothetical protein
MYLKPCRPERRAFYRWFENGESAARPTNRRLLWLLPMTILMLMRIGSRRIVPGVPGATGVSILSRCAAASQVRV